MPSRLLTALILLFWAGSSCWFFFVEFWPQIRGGDAPPFVIDLADEARKNSPPISWKVLRGGKSIGTLSTSIHYRESDDSFELVGKVSNVDLGLAGAVEVVQMVNTYRINRDGKLLSINAEAILRMSSMPKDMQLKVLLDSLLEGSLYKTTLKLESKFLNRELKLPEVPMSNRGSALNPLHPVDRIRGLTPGKTWRIALFDPIREALSGMLPFSSSDVTYLQAQVLPETRTLEWAGKDRECYVIEYTGDGVKAQTWVLVSDGSVLRQEARFHQDELVLERTTP
jgi:hypothetical protein